MSKNKETIQSLLDEANGALYNSPANIGIRDITSIISSYHDFYALEQRFYEYFTDIAVFMPNPGQNNDMRQLMQETFSAFNQIQSDVSEKLEKISKLVGERG